MEFAHDVFVSYSSADREWAIHLNDLLTAPGMARTTFFDRASLRAGDDWEARIEAGLAGSKHFVALWSDSAKNSDWVQREITTFYNLAKPRDNPDRRQIFLNLAGQNSAYGKLHQIVLPPLQVAYGARTPEKEGIWHEVGVAMAAGLDPESHAFEVPLVVMTLTRDQLEAYPLADREWLDKAFNVSIEQLAPHYGPTRDDWQPLAGAKPIHVLLQGVKREIESALGRREVIWKEPEQGFWTEPQAVEEYVRDVFLKKDLALLVIDPVALHDRETLSRLNFFRECFERTQSVIAVLPPFEMPLLHSLKRELRVSAMLYLDEYLKPRFPPRHQLNAQCVWNAGDADDIRRHMLLAAGRLAAGPATASLWTGMGDGR